MTATSGLTATVIGAGGYVGGELLRLLGRHPQVTQVVACSPSRAGQDAAATHPALRHGTVTFTDAAAARPGNDVVFFATPARVAAAAARAHLDAGSLVVDCSPDFRLRDLDTWARWYGGAHPDPDLVGQAAYGLVEHGRDALRDARLVAAPGCYATIMQLAIVPLARELARRGAADATFIVDALSGTSGAGRQADRPHLLLAEAGNNLSAYALAGHRHVPEVRQGIATHAPGLPAADLRFVPHLLPVPRGMFATVHVVGGGTGTLAVDDLLQASYAGAPFVDVLAPGTSPQLAGVIGTNRCVLSAGGPAATVLAALDNLGKGAAGQAVQAMNVALGIDERAALD